MVECTIEWNVLSLAEWETRFATIRRSNMLQSYPYAQASALTHHHKPRWGLIKMDAQEAGLVQVFETRLLGLHTMILDRGPLWLQGIGTVEHQTAFFTAFNRLFPRRFGRRRRIIPETSADSVPSSFHKVKSVKSYQTIWIDLTKKEEALRASLDRRWRNHLNKAERELVKVEWTQEGEALDWLLLHHDAHRTMKNFRAASSKFIRRLAHFFGLRNDVLIGRVFVNEEPVAGVLFFRHGLSATYQVGWSGEQGRKVNAHHLLLWQAMIKLKSENICDLDLGGINDVAEGVRIFKEGMGGDVVTFSGIYT